MSSSLMQALTQLVQMVTFILMIQIVQAGLVTIMGLLNFVISISQPNSIL